MRIHRALPVAALLVLTVAPAGAQSQETRLFAVTFTTGPAWDTARPPGEQSHMSEHSRNLFRLRDEQRIVAGGRFGEFGLVVVRAATADAARALFDTDLAVANGVFDMRIEPWLTIFDGCIPGAGSGDSETPAVNRAATTHTGSS